MTELTRKDRELLKLRSARMSAVSIAGLMGRGWTAARVEKRLAEIDAFDAAEEPPVVLTAGIDTAEDRIELEVEAWAEEHRQLLPALHPARLMMTRATPWEEAALSFLEANPGVAVRTAPIVLPTPASKAEFFTLSWPAAEEPCLETLPLPLVAAEAEAPRSDATVEIDPQPEAGPVDAPAAPAAPTRDEPPRAKAHAPRRVSLRASPDGRSGARADASSAYPRRRGSTAAADRPGGRLRPAFPCRPLADRRDRRAVRCLAGRAREGPSLMLIETFTSDCMIILGDCLSNEVQGVLPITDGLITDPPYAFNNSGGGKFRKARKASDGIVRHGLDKGFDLAALALGEPPSVMVFCHNDQLATLLPHLAARFHRHALLSAHKTNPSPFANKHYLADTEFYIHAWNRGSHPVGAHEDLRRWSMPSAARSEFDHPTVKPLELMRKLVRNMRAVRILDPFMGTGTTGEACLIEGRGFVGIEKDPAFFDMACRRLERAARAAEGAA